MTACREILELMSASLDQALSPAERALIDLHLAECRECQAAWKDLQWAHAQIKGVEKVEPPVWLASKIMARVRAEAAPEASFWRRFILPIVLKPQLQVASILLLAATGFYLLRSQRSTEEVLSGIKGPPPTQAPPQNQAGKSGDARDQATLESKSARKELQPPAPGAESLNRSEASRPSGTGFVLPPPAKPAPERAGRDRELVLPGAPAAAPPSPTAAAETTVGGALSVAAEPAPAAPRQTKKSLQKAESPGAADRAVEGAIPIVAESASRTTDQPERNDKSDATTWVIRLEIADARFARPMIERELARAGATVLPQRGPEVPRALRARLDPDRLPKLLSRLARIGKVVERPELSGEKPSMITLTIGW